MAALHNLTHVSGDTFRLQVTWQDNQGDPIDLTSYTAQMQVRDRAGGSVWASSTGGSPSLTLTLGGASGTIDIAGTVAQSTPAVGYWDLQVTLSGAVTTLVGGNFTVVQEVTA
jgi:hypothetical protein